MNTLTPRRTEYKGIVFRSKLEAQFALLLDNRLRSFIYEWEWLRSDIHGNAIECPDFTLVGIYSGRPYLIMIEIKPSRPTETYMEEIRQRFFDWDVKIGDGFDCRCFIVCVDFYKGDVELIMWDADRWINLRCDQSFAYGLPVDFDRLQFERIKNFRFDLQH